MASRYNPEHGLPEHVIAEARERSLEKIRVRKSFRKMQSYFNQDSQRTWESLDGQALHAFFGIAGAIADLRVVFTGKSWGESFYILDSLDPESLEKLWLRELLCMVAHTLRNPLHAITDGNPRRD